MAKITNENGTPWAVTGSPERVLDRAPSGVLWLGTNHDDDLYLWYSRDEGNTWSYSGSEVDVLSSYFVRALHIDNGGHLHAAGRVSNTQLRYFRGHPRTATSWDFDGTGRQFTFSVANEALAPDSGLDLVAWSVGDTYKAFILFGTTALAGGVYTNTLRLAELTISASRVITLTKTSVLRTATGGSYPYGCLAFAHAGDGKTPSNAPHVYAVTSVNTPDVTQARQDDLQLVKFTAEAGSWTQGSPVTLEAAVDTTGRTMRCSYDGARVVTVYGTCNRATGVASAAVHEVDWLESSGAATRNDPPAYGGGYPTGVSSAVDPASDDIYAAAYGTSVATPVWTRFSRSTGTWAPWTTFGATLAGWTRSGRLNLKQYVQRSAIEVAYAAGSSAPWSVNYLKLTATNTAPATPALVAPAPSSVADLGSLGAVFAWTFSDPDPGDLQGGWQMRRRVGAGAYSYYSASTQTWGAVAVWNTGAEQLVSFPAGVWTNGSVWSWSVNTRDAAGLPSGFAPDVSVTASPAPTVTVTSPLGIYALDSSPTITWSYLGAAPQRTYQVRVFDLATYAAAGFDPASSAPVWDSGETPTVQARATRVGLALLNQGTYRAFIRVSDSNALYSAWSYGEFLLSLTPTPAPLVEMAIATDYLSRLPKVRLTVQGLANMLSADQAYDHPAGDVQWEAINCTVGNSPIGVVTQSPRALKLTSLGAGLMQIRTFPGTAVLDTTGATPTTPRNFPARPGQVYTALASFTADATPRSVRVNLSWWSPADVMLGVATGVFLADMVGFPTQATVSGICPIGADRVRLTVDVLGVTAAGEIHYVDAIDLHPGTSLNYSPGGLVAQQVFTATRTLPDGTVRGLRDLNQLTADPYQRLTAYDREMPFGTPVVYQVQSVVLLTTGQTLASDPSPGALAVVDSPVWAVRDPVDPAAEAPALTTDFEVERASLTTVYRPAGRRLPLVESQGSTGDDGKATIWVSTPTERRFLRSILDRQTELLLQSPSGDQWYIWVIKQSPKAGAGQGQSVGFDYVEVEAP